MACGCAIVASDTAPVQEFITHGKTGILTPFLDPAALAERVVEQLDGGPGVKRMREAARRYAEAHLNMADYLTAYERLIASITAPAPVARRRKTAARG